MPVRALKFHSVRRGAWGVLARTSVTLTGHRCHVLPRHFLLPSAELRESALHGVGAVQGLGRLGLVVDDAGDVSGDHAGDAQCAYDERQKPRVVVVETSHGEADGAEPAKREQGPDNPVIGQGLPMLAALDQEQHHGGGECQNASNGDGERHGRTPLSVVV